MALLKFCKCGKLIEQIVKMCKDCERKQTDRYKEYKSNREDEKEQAFYISKPWLARRLDVMQRDNGLCQLCLSKDLIGYIDIIHHIVELKEDWNRRLDINNLIGVCESCHKYIHVMHKKDKTQMQEILINILKEVGGT